MKAALWLEKAGTRFSERCLKVKEVFTSFRRPNYIGC